MKPVVQPYSNLIFKAGFGLMTLLATVLGYSLYDAKTVNENQQAVINAKVEELASARVRLDSIGLQIDSKIAEIKQLGGKIEELEATKAQLEQDKDGLKQVNSFSARKYETKISNYIALLTIKDEEIVELKKQNGILVAENKNLSTENLTLNSENSTLKVIKKTLSDSVSQYSVKNKELSAKVNMAASLKAQDVQVFAISAKGKQRETGSYRTYQVDKIRVNFSLATNPITKLGEKVIFARILDPEGAILSDNAMGSGTFNLFGKDAIYSAKQQIQYSNTNQFVDILYVRGGVEYKKGRYAVELYSEGYKIGEGSFEVK